jgi:hypothetical protein
MNRREVRADALAETATRLFKEGKSYRAIGNQLGLTKEQVKAKVRVGLSTTPQMAHQERKLK